MLRSFTFHGEGEGPRLLFLGGVHGNEPCGVIALNRILEQLNSGALKITAGQVTIIPCCNEKAFAGDVIYIDENLNRCVQRHPQPENNEQAIADELTRHIDDCDILIDLHSTTAPTTPFGFLDTDSEAGRALAQGMGLERLLIDWPALYPGGEKPTTQTYAESVGKLAITIECGQHREAEAPARGENYVLNALSYLGMTASQSAASAAPAPVDYLRMSHIFYQNDNYVFTKEYRNFMPLAVGETIATNPAGAALVSPVEGIMIMPRAIAKDGEELFYMAIRD